MKTHIGHATEPTPKRLIEPLQRRHIGTRRPEITPDIFHPTFHLTLSLCPVGATQPGPKTIMVGKVEILRVPVMGTTGVVYMNHRFLVVME